eukprot:6213338-Pleurochrysis_carterae.AAC.3
MPSLQSTRGIIVSSWGETSRRAEPEVGRSFNIAYAALPNSFAIRTAGMAAAASVALRRLARGPDSQKAARLADVVSDGHLSGQPGTTDKMSWVGFGQEKCVRAYAYWNILLLRQA